MTEGSATSTLSVFAACAPGLEPLLAREVADLAPERLEEQPGGVLFEGGLEALHRAHLELGLASHLRVRLATFRARGFSELVRKAEAVDWARFLRPGQPLRLSASSRRSRLYHTKAIVERLRTAVTEATGRPPAEGDEADPALVASFERDQCTLSLDTSGEPLHRRGYRLATAKAPLREDLARALVVASGWEARGPLHDPFCGSGTVALEAARLARHIAPGRHRRFALERTPLFDEALWARLLEEADARALASAPAPLFASDRDPGAVEAARANAQRAGVAGDLRIEQAPLSGAPFTREPLAEHGALVTNPPHGQRVGRRPNLAPLYQSLGHLLEPRPETFRVALLVADRRLALRTGLPLETAALTEQGGHRVRLVRC